MLTFIHSYTTGTSQVIFGGSNKGSHLKEMVTDLSKFLHLACSGNRGGKIDVKKVVRPLIYSDWDQQDDIRSIDQLLRMLGISWSMHGWADDVPL